MITRSASRLGILPAEDADSNSHSLATSVEMRSTSRLGPTLLPSTPSSPLPFSPTQTEKKPLKLVLRRSVKSIWSAAVHQAVQRATETSPPHHMLGPRPCVPKGTTPLNYFSCMSLISTELHMKFAEEQHRSRLRLLIEDRDDEYLSTLLQDQPSSSSSQNQEERKEVEGMVQFLMQIKASIVRVLGSRLNMTKSIPNENLRASRSAGVGADGGGMQNGPMKTAAPTKVNDLGALRQRYPALQQFYTRLLDFQKEGVEFLFNDTLSHGLGAILADDMGLGKTVQTIFLLAALGFQHLALQEDFKAQFLLSHPEGESATEQELRTMCSSQIDSHLLPFAPVILVAPLSTIPNWVQEFERFAPPNMFHVFGLNGPMADRSTIIQCAFSKMEVQCHWKMNHSSSKSTRAVEKILTSIVLPCFSNKNVSLRRAGGEVPLHRITVFITAPDALVHKTPAGKGYQLFFRFTGQYGAVVVDEAQCIKNSQSAVFQSCMSFSAKTRLALTGTPLQNNVGELFSILRFVLPRNTLSVSSGGGEDRKGNHQYYRKWTPEETQLLDMVDYALNKFSTSALIKYSTGLKKELVPLVPSPTPHTNSTTGMQSGEIELFVCRQLHRMISPFVLRREKQDVLRELPQKVDFEVNCPVTPVQSLLLFSLGLRDELKTKEHQHLLPAATSWITHQMSEAVTQSLANLMNKDGTGGHLPSNNHSISHEIVKALIDPQQPKGILSHTNSVRASIVARKILLHPFAMCHEFPIIPDMIACSGKMLVLDFILDFLLATKLHKVLIFCFWIVPLDIIETYLTYKGIGYLRLDGKIKAENRQENIVKFNSSTAEEISCFLVTKTAGGVGLNLQVADTVVLFDTDYNPQRDEQALSRVYRVGQRRDVRILRFLSAFNFRHNVVSSSSTKNLGSKELRDVLLAAERGRFTQSLTYEARISLISSGKKNLDDKVVRSGHYDTRSHMDREDADLKHYISEGRRISERNVLPRQREGRSTGNNTTTTNHQAASCEAEEGNNGSSSNHVQTTSRVNEKTEKRIRAERVESPSTFGGKQQHLLNVVEDDEAEVIEIRSSSCSGGSTSEGEEEGNAAVEKNDNATAAASGRGVDTPSVIKFEDELYAELQSLRDRLVRNAPLHDGRTEAALFDEMFQKRFGLGGQKDLVPSA